MPKKVVKKKSMEWNAKNINAFRKEYKALTAKYGFDHKFKLIAHGRFTTLLIQYLFQKRKIQLIVKIVQPHKSISTGVYPEK